MENRLETRMSDRTLQRILLGAVRFMLLIALPLESIQGYGDFPHFFDLAWLAVDGGGGLPFIGHWVEFPPLFPFLSILLYRLAGGMEHRYVYLLALLLVIVDVGNLILFQRLAEKLLSREKARLAGWVYTAFLLLPAFGWWTFDPIGVFFALLSLVFVFEAKPVWSGLAAGLGFLTKLVPVLSLLGFLAKRRWKAAAISAIVLVVLAGVVLIPILQSGGAFAQASFRAQFMKGSWETVWALIDGNLTTGSYGPIEEHLSLEEGVIARGAPARIPHWIPSLVAAGFGLWLFFRMRRDDIAVMGIITAAWCVVFLWSRGWSPQWLAYLVPFLLLALPLERGMFYIIGMMLTSLIEWPLLLSRGRFDLLWLTVPLRTLVLLLLTITLVPVIIQKTQSERGAH